ncbi:MAG: phage tail tape measure protein [Victivallales bacterium]|nr:phage tail tape measure protein [Victivallales bacterium]
MFDLGTIGAVVRLDDSQYTQTLAGMGQRSEQQLNRIKRLFASALGGYGAYRILKEASGAAMEFSAEVANIASIADDLDMTKIRNGILGIDSVLGDSTKLANSFYFAYSAGIRGTEKEMVDFTAKMAQMAVTIRADQTQAMDAATSLMNAYRVSVKDAGKITDWFFTVVKEGKTTGEKLSGSLGMVVNSAATAKIPLSELGAAIAVLTRTMPTEQAITSLNQVIAGFISPTKEATETAAKYNIELSAAALQNKGLAAAMKEVKDKAGDDVEALSQMFGSIRSFRAAASLAGTQAEEFHATVEKFKTNDGSMLEAFGKQTDNLKTTWKTAMTDMNKAAISLGDTIAPLIKLAAAATTGIAHVSTSPALLSSLAVTAVATVAGKRSDAAALKAIQERAAAAKSLSAALGMSVEKSGRMASLWQGAEKSVAGFHSSMKGVSTLGTSMNYVAGAAAAVGTAIAGWEIGKQIGEALELDKIFLKIGQNLGLAERAGSEKLTTDDYIRQWQKNIAGTKRDKWGDGVAYANYMMIRAKYLAAKAAEAKRVVAEEQKKEAAIEETTKAEKKFQELKWRFDYDQLKTATEKLDMLDKKIAETIRLRDEYAKKGDIKNEYEQKEKLLSLEERRIAVEKERQRQQRTFRKIQESYDKIDKDFAKEQKKEAVDRSIAKALQDHNKAQAVEIAQIQLDAAKERAKAAAVEYANAYKAAMKDNQLSEDERELLDKIIERKQEARRAEKKYSDKIYDIQNQKDTQTAIGSFNAAVLQIIGGGTNSPQERTAKASEQSAKLLKKVEKNTQDSTASLAYE